MIRSAATLNRSLLSSFNTLRSSSSSFIKTTSAFNYTPPSSRPHNYTDNHSYNKNPTPYFLSQTTRTLRTGRDQPSPTTTKRDYQFDNEPTPTPPENNEPPPEKPKSKLGYLAYPFLFLAFSGKKALIALKLTKAAPLVSMLLTSATYSLFFGPAYGIGMVAQIVIHESGHAVALNYYGRDFNPMVLIPFMGAVIVQKDSPLNAKDNAMVAIAGPIAGSTAAAALAVYGSAFDSQICIALADFGLMINLFNLLPIGSLDGGQISGAIHPYIGVAGTAAGGLMIYQGVIGNPIFYLIVGSGAYTSYQRIFGEDSHDERFYDIPASDRFGILVAYLTLIGVLIKGMEQNNKKRLLPSELRAGKIKREEGEKVDLFEGGEDVDFGFGSLSSFGEEDETVFGDESKKNW